MKLPKLRTWREAKGFSQRELAEQTGITEWSIARAEHGFDVRPATARRYAGALGVEVADLLEEPPVPLAR